MFFSVSIRSILLKGIEPFRSSGIIIQQTLLKNESPIIPACPPPYLFEGAIGAIVEYAIKNMKESSETSFSLAKVPHSGLKDVNA